MVISIYNPNERQIEESLQYAHRLQLKLLPSVRLLKENFEESFVLFRPAHLVSSGFYWFNEHYGKFMIAVVCCNAQVFEGALMTSVVTGYLNRITQEKAMLKPTEVLQELHQLISVDYAHDETPIDLKIGFAIIDMGENTLYFAGAGLPLFRFRRGKMTEYPGNDFVLGNAQLQTLPFKHEIIHEQLEAGDMIYLFTDGIINLLATETDKEHAIRRFQDLLTEIQSNDADEQGQLLERIILNRWPQAQTAHDLVVLGLRVAQID